MGRVKLSIIIPAYNAEPYLKELVECLSKQINWNTEVIIVDDGSRDRVEYSYPWLTVIRQENKGAGAARNTGIDNAKGEYLTFVDADDLVADNYIPLINAKIDEMDFDVCEMSWKSLNSEGTQFDYKLSPEKTRLTNCSSCMRVFKKTYIGDVRFSEIKDATQDEDFSRRLGYLSDESIVRTYISDYMYFYRTAVCDSQVKQYKKGYKKTKRVVYYYNHVTSDMKWLVDEIRKDDQQHEVWLITNKCDIPTLSRWCQIYKPMKVWTHYLKGEPYKLATVIPIPHRTQIVLYVNRVNMVGGIQTFVYNFAKTFGDKYDITYVVNEASKEHIDYASKIVTTLLNPTEKIVCNTLIMLRIIDKMPENIEYKKSIQMCHACKTNPRWHIPQTSDYIVTVSQASKDSFGEEGRKGRVIHNPIVASENKPLVLMSATRIPAPDKGSNEMRMRKLANMLNDAGISFLWFNFSDGAMQDPPKNFINVGLHTNASEYFRIADYIVLLSDSEAWSYTLLEALNQDKPVLVCPFPSALEMGIEDGVNGYIVPFDMNFDITKILNIPDFNYEYDIQGIINQWEELLDAPPLIKHETSEVVQQDEFETQKCKVRVLRDFKDIHTGNLIRKGETVMDRKRVNEILENQRLKKLRLIEVLNAIQ